MRSQNRTLIVGIIITILCTVYILKLALLQWFPNSHLKTVQGQLSYSRNWRYDAIKQRQSSLLLHDGRALYKDDQGNIIHKEVKEKLLITPYILKNEHISYIIEEMSIILRVEQSTLAEQILPIKKPSWLNNEHGEAINLTAEQVMAFKQKRWFGTYILQTIEEEEYAPYVHAIGFTAQNPDIINREYGNKLNRINSWSISTKIGVMGLERSLDPLLHGVEPERIAWYEDIQGDMIAGLGLNAVGKHHYYPLNVQTTLNLNLQQAITKLVEQNRAEKIAAVLIDIQTNDVKAMVSKPQLFPRKFDEQAMKNLAITSHRPGSIYKIITMAAALEYGLVKEDEHFYCNGEYGKYGLSCWKKDGHGKQTLEQAFSNSCNVAFAQISERLSSMQLYQTALSLGGVEAIGWQQEIKGSTISMFIEEEKGRVFVSPQTEDHGEIAQASIGQRDTLLNPLQAASIVAAIARGGQALEARVASNITFADGKELVQFKPHKLGVSPYKLKASTIYKLQQYMRAVVESGTGQQLKDAPVQVAGKSGTAQLGEDEKSSNHYWFIGYFPVEKPKYALAVVVLNEKQSNNPATALFKEILEALY